MLVNSQQFDQIEISDDEIINMVKPILGFEALTKYCLIERGGSSPFVWLQSIDDPAMALPVINPCEIVEDYSIEIIPNEISEIEPTNLDAIEVFVIATVPNDRERITVNLQAPILINKQNGKGKQLVLVNSDYNLRYAVFEDETIDTSVEPTPLEEPAGAF